MFASSSNLMKECKLTFPPTSPVPKFASLAVTKGAKFPPYLQPFSLQETTICNRMQLERKLRLGLNCKKLISHKETTSHFLNAIEAWADVSVEDICYTKERLELAKEWLSCCIIQQNESVAMENKNYLQVIVEKLCNLQLGVCSKSS